MARRIAMATAAGLAAVGLAVSAAGGASADRAAEAPAVHAEARSGAVRPVPGTVVRPFDPPTTRFGAGHRGVDLAGTPGEPVRAALPGTVRFSGEVARRGWVTVDHTGGLDTTYGWLDPRHVRAGQRVGAGQVLGLLAEDANHLDWGARLDGRYLDPLALLARWQPVLVPLPPEPRVSPVGVPAGYAG